MKSRYDNLYWLFERHLFSVDFDSEQSANQFVDKVVNEFWHSFKSSGVILDQHIEEIKNDLREEVHQMLKKKTYGHFSLQSFRRKFCNQKDHC